jgi:hypothetical protein
MLFSCCFICIFQSLHIEICIKRLEDSWRKEMTCLEAAELLVSTVQSLSPSLLTEDPVEELETNSAHSTGRQETVKDISASGTSELSLDFYRFHFDESAAQQHLRPPYGSGSGSGSGSGTRKNLSNWKKAKVMSYYKTFEDFRRRL